MVEKINCREAKKTEFFMAKLCEAEKRRKSRKRRHISICKKIKGTNECPRLNVFRSLKQIYVQVINDTDGTVLCAASTLSKDYNAKGYKGNCDAAKQVGVLIAKNALAKGVKKVCFDRGGYKYHGRVKALADAAREGGLKF